MISTGDAPAAAACGQHLPANDQGSGSGGGQSAEGDDRHSSHDVHTRRREVRGGSCARVELDNSVVLYALAALKSAIPGDCVGCGVRARGVICFIVRPHIGCTCVYECACEE